MDRTPPPFFHQGPSARARLAFFALAAVALLIVDARFTILTPLRQGVAAVLYYPQRALLLPREASKVTSDYVGNTSRMRDEVQELRRIEAVNAKALLAAEQLAAENAELRRLLALRDQQSIKSISAEVLYAGRDPFSYRVVIDRGIQHGVAVGHPVIDSKGLVGQISRAFPLTAEVSLVVDRSLSVPVVNARTGVRSVAYGGIDGRTLELRFVPPTADLALGDVITTSGLDGIYPAGIPVAKITAIERGGANQFARVICSPLAGSTSSRYLLVLAVEADLLPPPPPPLEKPVRGKARENPRREEAKDAGKEAAKEAPKEPPKDASKDAAKDPAPAPAKESTR